jgi:pentose-5-phosphate-3-epimerase
VRGFRAIDAIHHATPIAALYEILPDIDVALLM